MYFERPFTKEKAFNLIKNESIEYNRLYYLNLYFALDGENIRKINNSKISKKESEILIIESIKELKNILLIVNLEESLVKKITNKIDFYEKIKK